MFWNLKAHMQAASTLATAHYPETLDRIFIIGAPYFFSTVWGWIKRWFDPITVSKIFILSANEVKPTLEEFIEPRNIPKLYGGELEFNFFDRPNVDPKIKGALSWENGFTDFPEGPAYWVPEDGGKRLVCYAVGSKGGQERRERVCSIPVAFPREEAAEGAVKTDVAAAPADSSVDAATEAVERLAVADDKVASEIGEKMAAEAQGQEEKAAVVSA